MKIRATAIAATAAAAAISAAAAVGIGCLRAVAAPDKSDADKIVCPVTGIRIESPDKAAATEVYQGKTFYFATVEAHTLFDSDPARYSMAADHGKTGLQMFHGNCAGCHGGDSGKGSFGPNLQKTKLLDDAIENVIVHGRGRMPGFGSKFSNGGVHGKTPGFASNIGDGDIQALIAYLHVIHEKPATPPTPTPTPTPTPNPPAAAGQTSGAAADK